jgi:hypothetical protein
MTMGEAFSGSPKSMGAEHGMVDLITLEAVDIGAVMIQMQHQAGALVSPRRGLRGLGMVGGDGGVGEKVTQADHRLGVEIGLVNTATQTDPGLLSAGQLNPEATILQDRALRPEGVEHGLNPGDPHPMLERVGEESLQGPEVVAFHPWQMSFEFHHVDRISPQSVEFAGGSQSGFMGVETVGLLRKPNLDETLVAGVDRDVTAIRETAQHIALRLRAVHRVGWVDIR